MPTIIAKRIKTKIKNLEQNQTRAGILIHYITQETDQEGIPKCTAIRTTGFPDSDYSIDEIIQEIQTDMEKPKLHSTALMTHWVISWKGENQPSHEEAFEAAKNLMNDLGYTQDHKQIFTIHENTNHIHVHIAASKVDQWTGKILNEGHGWYKNAAQKILVKIAELFGWELEPGHHFTKPKKPRTQPNYRTTAKDKHTQKNSEQTKLTEILTKFLEEHEKNFSRWKFGHLHMELAKLGIECQRVEIKPEVYGIIFSLDGKTFCKATTVCREMTYTKLIEKIGAKSWRDARPEVREILKETRGKITQKEKIKIQSQKQKTNKDWWKFNTNSNEHYVNINEIISKKQGANNHDQGRSQKTNNSSLESRTSRKNRLH